MCIFFVSQIYSCKETCYEKCLNKLTCSQNCALNENNLNSLIFKYYFPVNTITKLMHFQMTNEWRFAQRFVRFMNEHLNYSSVRFKQSLFTHEPLSFSAPGHLWLRNEWIAYLPKNVKNFLDLMSFRMWQNFLRSWDFYVRLCYVKKL